MNMIHGKQLFVLTEQIKKQGYKSLCFWLPAYNVGGGTYLLYQMAEYLAQNTDLKIYYVDYEGGYPHSLAASDSKVQFVNYKDGDIKIPILEPVILITNTTRACQIINFHENSKLLFWHYETFQNAWESVFFFGETSKFFRLIRDNHAIFYHDWSGKMSMNMQCKNVQFTNKDYIQVFLEPLPAIKNHKIVDANTINVGWLGRLGHDKIYALFNAIKQFDDVQTDKKKVFHIIGDGPNKNTVVEFCKNYMERIQFVFTGTIPHDNLPQYLQTNIDILFAVGTSTIEAARLKIPSVILMVSPKEYDSNNFIWLFDTKEYAVSILPEHKSFFDVSYVTMEEILSSIYVDNQKETLGEKCYEYYLSNHSDYGSIIEKLLQFCIETTLTFKQLKKCLKFIPYNIMEVSQLSIKGKALFSKVGYRNCIKYKFLTRTFWEKRIEKNITYYYFMGIIRMPFYTKKISGFKFPVAKFRG